MSTPENADHSSHSFAAGSKPHLLHKCLFNQLAQKLRKPPPIYQTQNEGSEHLPRFRSTVSLDDVSYTSSSTFQQRKMAEMDAARVAYIAITQKAKTESLNFIRETVNHASCGGVDSRKTRDTCTNRSLSRFAVCYVPYVQGLMQNYGAGGSHWKQPLYSYGVEDLTYCKSVIAEFAAKNNLRNPVYKTTHLEASLPVFRSHLLFDGVTYPGENGRSKKEAEQLVARSVIIHYLDSEAGYDMATVVNSKLRRYHEIKSVQNGSNVLGAETVAGLDFSLTKEGTSTMANSSATLESSSGQGTMVPPQPILPQVPVEPITPVCAPIGIQPPTPELSSTVPVVTPVVTESSVSQVAVEPIKSVSEPLVLTPIPSAVGNNPQTPAEIPANNLSAQGLENIPLVGETSNKKRTRKSRENARKKRRADAQMPSQVLPFSSQ